MIYTNQATSLARDIAVRSVIGLHISDHDNDVICAYVLYNRSRATTNENVHRSRGIVSIFIYLFIHAAMYDLFVMCSYAGLN